MNRRQFLKALGLTSAAVTFGGVSALTAPSSSLPGATGTTITTSGWSSAPLAEELTLSAGDVFTIAGQYAVNPITRTATKHLQQFVITGVTGSDVEFMPTRSAAIKKKKKQLLGAPNALRGTFV